MTDSQYQQIYPHAIHWVHEMVFPDDTEQPTDATIIKDCYEFDSGRKVPQMFDVALLANGVKRNDGGYFISKKSLCFKVLDMKNKRVK